jgi:hypothetical protein
MKQILGALRNQTPKFLLYRVLLEESDGGYANHNLFADQPLHEFVVASGTLGNHDRRGTTVVGEWCMTNFGYMPTVVMHGGDVTKSSDIVLREHAIIFNEEDHGVLFQFRWRV